MRKTRRPSLNRLVGFFSLALVVLAGLVGFCSPVSATGAEAAASPATAMPTTNSGTAAGGTTATGNSCPDGSIPTSVLGSGGCMSDDGAGSGISDMLTLVAHVMSVGIAIFAAIGIAVAGIQYLTAKGDEGQTRKSKQRLLEIVIGMVVYVLVYALLAWLLPGFEG